MDSFLSELAKQVPPGVAILIAGLIVVLFVLILIRQLRQNREVVLFWGGVRLLPKDPPEDPLVHKQRLEAFGDVRRVLERIEESVDSELTELRRQKGDLTQRLKDPVTYQLHGAGLQRLLNDTSQEMREITDRILRSLSEIRETLEHLPEAHDESRRAKQR